MSAHAESTEALLVVELDPFDEPFPLVVELPDAFPLPDPFPVPDPFPDADPDPLAALVEPLPDPSFAALVELLFAPPDEGKSPEEPPQLAAAAIPKKATID
jgi:hypothetical protein